MTARTTSMPTPRPETSVTSAAVLKPGSKISSCFLFGEALRFFGFEDASLHGVLANLCGIDAAAVVADFDDHLRSPDDRP